MFKRLISYRIMSINKAIKLESPELKYAVIFPTHRYASISMQICVEEQ